MQHPTQNIVLEKINSVTLASLQSRLPCRTLSAAVVAATREVRMHSLVVTRAALVDGRSRSSDIRTV